jgi:general secretion pathway protein B
VSYILDALRRADAERSRGAVPGLHAQSVPGDGEPAARNFRPLIWAAGGAGVLVVAAVVVLVFGPWRATPAPDVRVALAAAPELAPPARDNALAQGATPPVQPGALDPGARAIEPPIGRDNPPPRTDARPLQPYPPQRATAREPLAERAAAGRVATLEPRPEMRPPAAAAQGQVEHYGAPLETAASPAPARASAVPNLNDLPPNVRSQLPRLAVGGAIYSETPGARMVILNGLVFHEGDKPAPDTVLEQIRLKSAVLNFRGQRYEVAF